MLKSHNFYHEILWLIRLLPGHKRTAPIVELEAYQDIPFQVALARLFGPYQGLTDSFHTSPNALHWPGKHIRVQMNQTKQIRSESTLKLLTDGINSLGSLMKCDIFKMYVSGNMFRQRGLKCGWFGKNWYGCYWYGALALNILNIILPIYQL